MESFMFSTIKTMLQNTNGDRTVEARLEKVGEEVLSLLQAYERMDGAQRHVFTRAYHLAKKHLEDTLGEYGDWKKDDQVEAAKVLMNNARKAVDAEPRGAMGIALLGLFLEINTLRGKEAVQLSAQIDQWYGRALKTIWPNRICVS